MEVSHVAAFSSEIFPCLYTLWKNVEKLNYKLIGILDPVKGFLSFQGAAGVLTMAYQCVKFSQFLCKYVSTHHTERGEARLICDVRMNQY